ncbi:MAG: hypothetical protein J2P45_06830 [Candidatus Dormibacteraeota bacterium]|nr:hypothetical protein [Candidatus Dormibacteraeota bacterium]
MDGRGGHTSRGRMDDPNPAPRARANDSRHYLLPTHSAVIDRLDVQHYALRIALGALHEAPIDAPARVLDVGAGSGQWGWDLTGEERHVASPLAIAWGRRPR